MGPLDTVPSSSDISGWGQLNIIAPNAAAVARHARRYMQCWALVCGVDKDKHTELNLVARAAWNWALTQELGVEIEPC